MHVSSLSRPHELLAPAAPRVNSPDRPDDAEARQAFSAFVGETFYGQMLAAMRKTVGKPAYFHGGQAEEIFRGQLDQTIAAKLSESTAEQFAGPMYELFNLTRK